jgi:hypothetical protein
LIPNLFLQEKNKYRAKGKGQRAKGKGQRAKGEDGRRKTPLPHLILTPASPFSTPKEFPCNNPGFQSRAFQFRAAKPLTPAN